MIKIGRGEGLYRVTQHVGRQRCAGCDDRVINLANTDVDFDAKREVHRRYVHGRNAQRLRLQLAAQRGQYTVDTNGERGVYGNDRLHRAAGFTQILMVIAIEHRLIVHCGMDRGNHAVGDTKARIYGLQHGHYAVSCAGSIGDYFGLRAERIVINPVNHGGVDIAVGGLGKQHALGAVIEMPLSCCAVGEGAAALHHEIDVEIVPGQGGGVSFLRHTNLVAAYQQLPIALRDLAKETPVGAVIACQMRECSDVRKIIDRHDAQVGVVRRLVKSPQNAATYTAVAVYGDPIAHSSERTVFTTFSAVKPKCAMSSPPGADSPKLCMPMTLPSKPTNLLQ